MRGLMEKEMSGMTPKFLAWASECLEGATHRKNEGKRKARCRASLTRAKPTMLSSEVSVSHWPTSGAHREEDANRGTMGTSVTHSLLIPFFSVLRVYSNMPGASQNHGDFPGLYMYLKIRRKMHIKTNVNTFRSGVWNRNGFLGQNQSLQMNRWLCDWHVYSQPHTHPQTPKLWYSSCSASGPLEETRTRDCTKAVHGPCDLGRWEQPIHEVSREEFDTILAVPLRQTAVAVFSLNSVSSYVEKTKRIPVEALKHGKKQQAIQTFRFLWSEYRSLEWISYWACNFILTLYETTHSQILNSFYSL